ncbi:MAG: hydrogenase iron-sulfur subunit, partial [Candidatus Bathyarchaeota archaeon]
KRIERFWKRMERLGLRKDRLQLLWASAAEGERIASKVREMAEMVESVTSEEIEKTKQAFGTGR